MNSKDVLKNIPSSGFIKVGSQRKKNLTSSQRIALIRKGNELYNSGEYEKAKRVFLTTGYSDGLIRLGDLYLKNKKPYEALRMYWIAPAQEKKDKLIEKMSSVISRWINEERETANNE